MADHEILNFTLKENSLCVKFEAQDLASQVSNKHAFKIWRKKGSEIFDHGSTFIYNLYYLKAVACMQNVL